MEIKNVDNLQDIDCDVLIINKFENQKTNCQLIDEFAPETFTGKKGQIFSINTQKKTKANEILAIGLGNEKDLNDTTIRENVAKVIKKIKSCAKKVAINFNTNYEWIKPALIGASIANYSFDKYKTKKDEKISEIYVQNINPQDLEVVNIICKAIENTRNLSNEPASYATPSKLAEIAQNIEGIETNVYEKDKIEEMGMGAYLAVAKGSCEPPKFIHMKYTCQDAKKRIAIIGKGMCFDSGGLDIKPASSMLTMKDDMSGASCILGVMDAISKLKPNVEVHGIIAACENMPSGCSYKPGDILTAKNGKTIEVDNTDAEGRLTLADALCYACELGVDEVIDIATLTGACMVALGTAAAGIMGNNEEFVSEIINNGNTVGEKYWQLPMWQEYRDNMNSDIADMKNTGTRFGGASSAGMFLKEFVTENVKWAHLDVAGTAFLDKPQKEFSKGATAAGVRTLIEHIVN